MGNREGGRGGVVRKEKGRGKGEEGQRGRRGRNEKGRE